VGGIKHVMCELVVFLLLRYEPYNCGWTGCGLIDWGFYLLKLFV